MRKISPLRLGLACNVTGHFICGTGGIASVSGGLQVNPKLVTYCVLFGFALGALGLFITTYYTDPKKDVALAEVPLKNSEPHSEQRILDGQKPEIQIPKP